MRALSQNLITSDTSEAIGQLFPEVKMRLSRTIFLWIFDKGIGIGV